MMFNITHHSSDSRLHEVDAAGPELAGHCTALIIISPNERVSHTTAGTNARPMNSLILKLSSFQPRRLEPATNLNVKSGANMAYIQSFIARMRSMAARAIVNSPNTANMIVLMIDVCTIWRAALAISSGHSRRFIFSNLNIEYPYIMSGLYIPPAFLIKVFGEIQGPSVAALSHSTL